MWSVTKCLFANLWFIFAYSNRVEMFVKWFIFRSFWSVCMLKYDFCSYISMRTRCFAIDLYLVCLIRSRMFWNVFHQNVRSEIVCMNDVFFYIFYSIYNIFVLISKCLHRDVWSEFVSMTFFFQTWWHVWRLLNFQLCLVVNANVTYQK